MKDGADPGFMRWKQVLLLIAGVIATAFMLGMFLLGAELFGL